MSKAKQAAQEVIAQLPEEASWDDVYYEMISPITPRLRWPVSLITSGCASLSRPTLAMADFAQNLIALRKARKLTQLELAHLLDIQPRMLGRWEQGVVKPQFDHMVRLAQVLEVSLDQLVYGAEGASKTAFEINNKRLQELCKQVDRLPSDDQAVVCHFLDMAIRQDQFRRLAARPAA